VEYRGLRCHYGFGWYDLWRIAGEEGMSICES
jgi:hypothetical protein